MTGYGVFGVVVAALAILTSVMLHELGHFATARAFGMKVPQFFVGFGPTLWSFRRGETEYGVKALPLGGFVRIVGQTSLEEVAPEDQGHEMWRQPARRRAVVMSAGSVMHFLIGCILLLSLFLFVGQTIYGPGTTVGQVAACVDEPCTATSPDSPAKVAGVQPGDTILAVDGMPVSQWAEVTNQIRSHPGGTRMVLTVRRNGETRDLHPLVVSRERDSLTVANKKEMVGVIGISLKPVKKHYNVLSSLSNTGQAFWQVSTGTLGKLVSIPSKVPALFHPDKPRDPNGLISVVGAARIGGDAVQKSIPDFIALIASLNISIGVLNLLPLLPLDGGHLAIMGVEKSRSWVSRKLRRPDPGRIDMLKLLPATYLFLLLFGSISALLVFNDVVNPIPSPF